MKRIGGILGMVAWFCLAAGLAGTPARAGGLALYEMGTPDVGLASAGWAARAQDASTLFKNPAGMSLLPKSEFQAGVQATYGDVKFKPNSDTTTIGDNGPNPVGWVPGGSLFYVHKINNDLSAGLGVFNYFGGKLDYNNTWVGRHYAVESSLIGYTIMPAVSYKFTDWISVGAGLNATYATMKMDTAMKNFDRPDGLITYKDKEWGWGANVGVIVEPRKGTRIGVDYVSEMKLKFSDVPDISGAGPGLDALLRRRNAYNAIVDMSVYIPNMIMGSVYHELNPQWAVMANLGWQQWSKFGKPDLSVSTLGAESFTADLDYDDTWHVAGGVMYRPLKDWTFTGGVAYDSSAQDDKDRSVALPFGETWRFGVGTSWQFTPAVKLGLAYELAWTPDMKVDQNRGPRAGRLSGEYDTFIVHNFAFNVAWQF